MGVLVNRKIPSAAALSLILIAGLSCSDNSVTGPDNVATGPNGLTTDSLTADEARAIATVEVSLGSSTLAVGQTTQASVVFLDKYGRTLKRTVEWSSSNPAVASVDTSGLVKALSVGNTSIIATHRLHSGSAALSVQDSALPPPPPSGSHEPSGMNLISDRPFDALHELGWDEPSNGGSGGKIIQDATAPKSPSNILRVTYPAGFTGGGAPWDGDSPNFLYKKVYVSHWARVSTNWQNHPSDINKMYYLYTSTDVPSIVIVLYGPGGKPGATLYPYIEGQNIAQGGQGSADPQNPDWGPNLGANAVVTRGQWFHIELVAAMNTLGNADGYMDLWLNGTHITHVGGVKFQNSSPSWRSLHYAPVWGGGGGTVTNTMYMDWDQLYVSGKN